MSKSLTVASKFSQDELDRIDWFVKKNNTTRSALFHDLVMQGVSGEVQTKHEIPTNVKEVTFKFIEDHAYFWKGREYKGIINGDDASVFFGGEWKHFKLAELPVEVIY